MHFLGGRADASSLIHQACDATGGSGEHQCPVSLLMKTTVVIELVVETDLRTTELRERVKLALSAATTVPGPLSSAPMAITGWSGNYQACRVSVSRPARNADVPV